MSLSIPLPLVRDAAEPPRLLALFGLGLWLLVPVAIVALVLDPRTLATGDPVWMKPLKFAVSLGLFALTSAWALACTTAQARRGRTAWAVLLVIVAMSLFELGYIASQAAQGEASHFNIGDRFHARMYTLMGIAAVLLTATSGAVAWLVARHGAPEVHAALRHAIVVGFGLTVLLGIFTGAAMGGQPGHFVGHAPGAATVPVLGWSRWRGFAGARRCRAAWRCAHSTGWRWPGVHWSRSRMRRPSAGCPSTGGESACPRRDEHRQPRPRDSHVAQPRLHEREPAADDVDQHAEPVDAPRGAARLQAGVAQRGVGRAWRVPVSPLQQAARRDREAGEREQRLLVLAQPDHLREH
jgi:hypothetical protein